MALDAPGTADAIEARLRAVATPERAAAEKRYLKSDLDHLGASLPDMRREAKAFVRTHPGLSHEELVALVEALWARPVHERRTAAVLLLESYPTLVGPGDLALLERLIRESRTWALVDPLAGDVLGKLLARRPGLAARLDRWARDDDFWVRRAALLAWLAPLRGGALLDHFLRYADAMLDEKEFFIRKAIGWVLRDVGRRRPDEVFAWLEPRTRRVSGVTIREAVKYLDAAQREALLRAYRAR